MSCAGVRVGAGTTFRDGNDLFRIVKMHTGNGLPEIAAEDLRSGALCRFAMEYVLFAASVRILGEDLFPTTCDLGDPIDVLWDAAPEGCRRDARTKAAHIREVLTGYRSGNPEFPEPGEPRPQYRPDLPKGERVRAKCKEMNWRKRTLDRWMSDFDARGEPGLISIRAVAPGLGSRQDPRWVQAAREVKAEFTFRSKPSQSLVIAHTNARLIARHGPDGIDLPSERTARRILRQEEKLAPLFTGSTKHTRDVAGRPQSVYGKLLPTRPGEYVLMDTTRLDVYAMDPQTLKYVGLDLTVAMDWYSRCIIGLRLTPTTRAIDAMAALYECFRPKPAGPDWPARAVWPAHGVPRNVWVDRDTLDPGSALGTATPAIVPDNLLVDHGKIFVSSAMLGVCRSMGISLAPARVKIPWDKGPVERFFGTVRTLFLQELPGYKGPDIYSRGLHPEKDSFYFISEMEALLREWIADVYHNRPHDGIGEPQLWNLGLSPAQMFARGVQMAGYIEAPRDPQLALNFLPLVWVKRRPEGIVIRRRVYKGEVLDAYPPGAASPYTLKKGRWPIRVNPDDVRTIYFFDHKNTGEWAPLTWDMGRAMELPMSEEGLDFVREILRTDTRAVDDRLAVAAMLDRRSLSQSLDTEKRNAALRLSREQSSLAADLDALAEKRQKANKRRRRARSVPRSDAIEAFVDELDVHEDEEDDLDDEFDDSAATYRLMEDM